MNRTAQRVFVLHLRAGDDGSAYRRLRRLLKTALRRDGLRCTSAIEKSETAAEAGISATSETESSNE
jgi:hypothetical protein